MRSPQTTVGTPGVLIGAPSPVRAAHTHSAHPKCREFPDSTAVSTAIASTAQTAYPTLSSMSSKSRVVVYSR
jgi:hypothetical protein